MHRCGKHEEMRERGISSWNMDGHWVGVPVCKGGGGTGGLGMDKKGLFL